MDPEFIEPEHPLPEELQNLGKKDSECEYCGIPYLIHSEVSKMKKRMAEMVQDVHDHQVFRQLI